MLANRSSAKNGALSFSTWDIFPEMKRVALLSPLPPFRGGISTFSKNLIRSSAGLAEVIPVNYKVQYPAFLFPGKSQFSPDAAVNFKPRLGHPLSPLAWKKTADFVVDTHSDTLVFAYWHPFFIPFLQYVAKKARKKKIKTVGLFHNVKAHDWFPAESLLLNLLLAETDLAVTLSTATSAELDQLKIPASKRLSLFHPVEELSTDETPSGKPWKRNPNLPLLVHFGLIRPYKGVDVFLKALDAIPDWWTLFNVTIAGENYMGEEALWDGVSADTKTNVMYENRFLSDDETKALLKEADYLVLPYRTASQSGIMAQAIGARKPVLASNLPGLSNFVIPEKTGWLFPVENIDAFAGLLRNLGKGKLKADGTALDKQLDALSWERFSRLLQEKL